MSYVYHGCRKSALKKIKSTGLRPSKDGFYGPGVYFSNSIDGAYEGYGTCEGNTFIRVQLCSLLGLHKGKITGLLGEDNCPITMGLRRENNEEDPYSEDNITISEVTIPSNMIEVQVGGEWFEL